MASENALSQLNGKNHNQLYDPMLLVNNLNDWTRFWKTMRNLGLNTDEVIAFGDSLMPKEWLDKHPECNLDYLIKLITEKYEQQELILK